MGTTRKFFGKLHVTVYLKLSQTPNIGIYAPLTGTVAGSFGEIE